MPLLQLDIATTTLTDAQALGLQEGLTRLMAEVLGKRDDLTVVALSTHAPVRWSRGGRPLGPDAWNAALVCFITAGTNSAGERGAFLREAHGLLVQVMGTTPAAPLYTVIHEVPADAWGYDGRSQLARRVGADNVRRQATP
jgi:4-oxalocrotonate tautomerase